MGLQCFGFYNGKLANASSKLHENTFSNNFTNFAMLAETLRYEFCFGQCWRRLYDTNFVSVYGGASNFSTIYATKPVLQWSDLNVLDLFATYLFLWSWWHQYQVTVILANLRKDDEGRVVTDAYRIPTGDWFDSLSSPHNFAEIMMYSSLTFFLWPIFTWWFIYAWVILNQVETALLSHWWYLEKFEDYPRNRKIILPCIY
ncbi:3-oxo-5-alpha-steroid 4-dehydrogenase [Popillia japonica]|uniref:Polyprenal reductase n=1 Tax=Popillia japonica TaxID=7064 RepID=A0AAW1LTY4_POPJA